MTPARPGHSGPYWLALLFLFLTACTTAPVINEEPRRAKNIILFVGDGMGVSTVTAARILEGQLRGEPGEENVLSFERFPHVALSKTYNTNQQTPDSAGTMTAMMTGEKTLAGVVSVNRHSRRQDCASAQGKSLETFLERAERAGKSTGIVTTTRVTHATPAATYAHSPERKWEGDSDMPPEAIRAGCSDMAAQLLDFDYGDGIEVVLGGGRRYFMPQDHQDPELEDKKGLRRDGRDLTREWLLQNRAAYVWNKEQLDGLELAHVDHLLGLFNYSHMQYEADRKLDPAGEPSLTDMTLKAIELLRKNRDGYFLMVEGGRIDHAHHAGNAYRALTDTIEFARAVDVARSNTSADDTLILVTADHSHVFTLAGYPTRGNPILGKVVANDKHGDPEKQPALAADNMPYTTAGYMNGAGYTFRQSETLTSKRRKPAAGRSQNLADIDTEDQHFHQQSLVPLQSETHGAEDVVIYADGPDAGLVNGVMEQNRLFDIMKEAMEL